MKKKKKGETLALFIITERVSEKAFIHSLPISTSHLKIVQPYPTIPTSKGNGDMGQYPPDTG